MRLRTIISWVSKGAELAFIALLGTLTFALNVKLPASDKPRIFLQAWIEFAQDWATVLGAAFFIAIVAAKVIHYFVQPAKSPEQARFERLITKALDEFRGKVFPDLPDSIETHLNRVTLFKKVSTAWRMRPARGLWFWPWGWWRGPWSGWLIIAHRSGHITQNSIAAFLCSNDGAAEGIAGKGYQCSARRAPNLPDINGEAYISWPWRIWYSFFNLVRVDDDAQRKYNRLKGLVEQYATLTETPPRLVWKRMKCKKVFPTNMLGIRVLDDEGEIWGSVVMDSCNTHVCIDSNDPRFRRAWKKLEDRLRLYGVFE